MALFMIEREFAKAPDLGAEVKQHINRLNTEMGLEWQESLLRADGKKTYCLYEAPNAERLLEQARVLGIPADVIVEVSRVSGSA
jgi:Nickel responsive protein SCO4226-like